MIRVIGPGDDVEAWCTRCRMNLNHRIIAIVGQSIQRVHCLTCGGDHKYYPPKRSGSSTTEKPRVKTAGGSTTSSSRDRSKATGERAAVRALSEWTTFMNEMSGDTVPRPYRITESYRAGEYVEHPEFGTGRVTDVLGAERIEVIFKVGRKVMICNRVKTS